jgi:hypothetical protein
VADVGASISVSGDHLQMHAGVRDAVIADSSRRALFRSRRRSSARVFAENDAGLMVMAGASRYAERQSRWRVESVRWPVLVSAAIVLTPLVMLLPGPSAVSRAPAARRRTIRLLVDEGLSAALRDCALLPYIGVMYVSDVTLGTFNVWTAAMFAGSALLPAAAILSFLFTIDAWRRDAGRWLRGYAMLVSVAALVVSGIFPPGG